MHEFKDVRGNLVDVGDTVAFAASGQRGGMRIGKIVRKTLYRSYSSVSKDYPVLVLNYVVKGWRGRDVKVGVVLTQVRTVKDVLKVEPDADQPT